MLIGPNAPLVIEPGLRGSYIVHAYDFYKPDLTSEYPVVDGQYSIKCYTEALDNCYRAYNAREEKLHAIGNGLNGINGTSSHKEETIETPLDRFDHIVFHSPTCKLVSKSYGRLLYNDFLKEPSNPLFASVPESIKSLDYSASFTDKSVEKTFMDLAKKRFQARVQPSIELPTMCGNMYSASVYSSLCSILTNIPADQLLGRRIGVFSYGSGLASSFFSIRVRGDVAEMSSKLDVKSRLANRRVVEPKMYDEMCLMREKAHLQKSYTPQGSTSHLFPGTYYLTGVDDMFRRTYAIKE